MYYRYKNPDLTLYYLLVGVFLGCNIVYAVTALGKGSEVYFFNKFINDHMMRIDFIFKPVNALVMLGNQERLALVKNVYGVNWLSFLLFAPLFLILVLKAVVSFYEENKGIFLSLSDLFAEARMRHLQAWTVVTLALLSLPVIYGAYRFYYGHIQPRGFFCGYLNCVVKRDIDLFLEVLYVSLNLWFLPHLAIAYVIVGMALLKEWHIAR